ncbi:hypothetical protein Q2T41_16905 [Maribacter confluentis]|uniref:Uncharacterized protein n=1 Tax=Maribacter confluentis TaxID=1656093 RepID=A0ABT8RWE9_9FLAO|nr:hypothetical protein [Maribacter confluentis]MDO1514336.1 hypothetical protein [Maribacter confluentis]
MAKAYPIITLILAIDYPLITLVLAVATLYVAIAYQIKSSIRPLMAFSNLHEGSTWH